MATGDGVDSSFITMPALSSTMTEGKVVQWLVKEGNKVITSGDVLFPGPGVVENIVGNIDGRHLFHRVRGYLNC